MSKKNSSRSRLKFAQELQHVQPNNIVEELDEEMQIKVELMDIDYEYYEPTEVTPPRTVILDENDENRPNIEAEIGLVSQMEFIKTEIDVDEVAINAFREEMKMISHDVNKPTEAEPNQEKQQIKKKKKGGKNKNKESKEKKKNESKNETEMEKETEKEPEKGKEKDRPKEKEKRKKLKIFKPSTIKHIDLEPVSILVKGKKMVKCPLCEFITTTRNRSYLKQHLRSHTGEKPFACLYCPQRFNANSSRYSHVKYHHPSKKTYRCSLCRMIFYKQSEFRSHGLNCVKTRSFECHLCGLKMKRLYKHKYKEHMRKAHTGERIFDCSQCSETFVTKESLSNHMQHHPDVLPFQCSVCQRRFEHKPQWKKHETNCISRRRLECHLCQYTYPRLTIEGLKMHMRKHTGEKPFQCQFCQKYYPRSEALAQHLQRHRDLFQHKCSQCHRRFLNTAQLEKHEQTCRRKRYECYLCGFTRFGLSFSKFRRHMMSHIGEKQMKCSGCNSSFSSAVVLARHVRETHPKLLALICLTCKRQFTSKSARDAHTQQCMKRCIECYLCGLSLKSIKQLRIHMAGKHTGEKKHQCHICSKKYQIAANLKMHLNSHSKSSLVKCQYCSKTFAHIKFKKKHEFRCKKVYECYLCNKTFPSFAILHGTHMRTHLGAKPYNCTHCVKSFASVRCYNLHVIKFHLQQYKFECNVCHKIIVNNKDLLSHRSCMLPIRQSQGVIYYKCSLCGVGLPRIPELRHHILGAKCPKHPKKQRQKN